VAVREDGVLPHPAVCDADNRMTVEVGMADRIDGIADAAG
jgi:hypothetical protein